MGSEPVKVFVIHAAHENDGGWSATLAVCASQERAERDLRDDGWIFLPEGIGGDFEWGRRYMDDAADVAEFDIGDGWEGAYIVEMEVLDD